MMRPVPRLLLVLVVLLGLSAGAAPARDAIRAHRIAIAILERWQGLAKVEGVWTGVTVTYKVTARRRLVDTRAVATDEATVRRTQCIETYEPARHGWAVVIRGDRATYLRTTGVRCSSRTTTVALPEGAFGFDEQLRTATLDASIGGRRFMIRWEPTGETRTQRRAADASWSGDPQDPDPAFTVASDMNERDAPIEGGIDGVIIFPRCTDILYPLIGRSRCIVRTVNEVVAPL